MIIIIDDNKDLNDITCQLLSILGYDVVSAFSGQDGIDKAREKGPKVILCDIGMPGMDGYDVAKTIRQDRDLRDIYLIAISGYSSQTDIDRSIEAGFDKHIGKPIDLQTLKTILDEVFLN